MRQNRRQQDPWEGYEFIDINSHSGEPAQRPRAPQRERVRSSSRSRGQPAREPQRRSASQRRASQRGSPGRRETARGAPPRDRNSGRRQAGKTRQRTPRKPMSKGLRRFLLVFTLLCGVAITAFLCVFLLFKVRTIQVTGDVVYDQNAIIQASGVEIGDNLALMAVGSREEAMEQKLPYVEKVELLRHFPSTLEIRITGATEAACISSGSQWFSVSGSGKILEERTGPSENAMQVTGLLLTDPVVGGLAKAQDEEHQQAFETILATVTELGNAGDFTSLEMTDLYNITMEYQNRISFLLGSTAGLDKKIQSGIKLVTEEIESNAVGDLDLTLVADKGKAFFTATNSKDNATSSGTDQSGEEGEETSSDGSSDSSDSSEGDGGESSDEDTSSQEEDTSSQDESRGGEIPDTIFTG